MGKRRKRKRERKNKHLQNLRRFLPRVDGNSFPLIGITGQSYGYAGEGYHYIRSINTENGYHTAITQSNGLALSVRTKDGEGLRKQYEKFDGLLLTGGGDVCPTIYGEERLSSVWGLDAERDLTEIQLLLWALQDNKPILGICRGLQIMAVALGGTLFQDIPDQICCQIPHFSESHAIYVNPNTLLADILGSGIYHVNSLHHQCIKHVPYNMTINAIAPDGVIESANINGVRFALGVQFHPEMLPNMRSIFARFIKACKGDKNV